MTIFVHFHPIFYPYFHSTEPHIYFFWHYFRLIFLQEESCSMPQHSPMGNIRNMKKGNPGKDCPLYFLENSITKLEIKLPSPRAEKPDCPISLMEDEKDEFLHQFASRSIGVVEALHLGIHLLHLGNNLHHLHSIIVSHSCRIIAHTPG